MSYSLCFKVDSVDDNGRAVISVYEGVPNPTLKLTTTTGSGSSTSDVDLSCLTSAFLSADDIKASFSCTQYVPYEDSVNRVSINYYDANGNVLSGQNLSNPASGMTYNFTSFPGMPVGASSFSLVAYLDNSAVRFDTEKYPISSTFAPGTILPMTESLEIVS